MEHAQQESPLFGIAKLLTAFTAFAAACVVLLPFLWRTVPRAIADAGPLHSTVELQKTVESIQSAMLDARLRAVTSHAPTGLRLVVDPGTRHCVSHMIQLDQHGEPLKVDLQQFGDCVYVDLSATHGNRPHPEYLDSIWDANGPTGATTREIKLKIASGLRSAIVTLPWRESFYSAPRTNSPRQ